MGNADATGQKKSDVLADIALDQAHFSPLLGRFPPFQKNLSKWICACGAFQRITSRSCMASIIGGGPAK